jgi:uncharacterized membrane protein YsdA (DUF1294 family)
MVLNVESNRLSVDDPLSTTGHYFMPQSSPRSPGLFVAAGVISGIVALGLAGITMLIWLLLPHSGDLVTRLTDKTTALIALGVALIPLLFVARLAFRSTRALSYQAAQRHARIWDDIRSAQFWLLIPVLGMATVLIRPALLGALANQSAIRAILSWLPEYSAWCAAVSALAFLHFGADKYVAIKRELSPDADRRTAEKFLIAFAIWGGWPGAFAAMAAFRHKTADIRFRAGIWRSFAIHLVILTVLVALVWWRTTK